MPEQTQATQHTPELIIGTLKDTKLPCIIQVDGPVIATMTAWAADGDAECLTATFNSYRKHCGPRAVECAEGVDSGGDLLGELLQTCTNAAASLAICQMPRLDNTVADNTQIIAIVLESLRVVLAKVKGGTP